MAPTVIDEGLATWSSPQPQLIGSRCPTCGATTFPRQEDCPRGDGAEMADHLLPPEGTLWTFTVQSFPPKPPYPTSDPFVPYAVGYVDLGEVMVEARLTESDPDRLAIGAPMRLVVVPFAQLDDGTDLLTYAFSPIP